MNYIFRVSVLKFLECFQRSCFDSPFIYVHKSSMMIYNEKREDLMSLPGDSSEKTKKIFVNPL